MKSVALAGQALSRSTWLMFVSTAAVHVDEGEGKKKKKRSRRRAVETEEREVFVDLGEEKKKAKVRCGMIPEAPCAE